jgi:hypothetical protein
MGKPNLLPIIHSPSEKRYKIQNSEIIGDGGDDYSHAS